VTTKNLVYPINNACDSVYEIDKNKNGFHMEGIFESWGYKIFKRSRISSLFCIYRENKEREKYVENESRYFHCSLRLTREERYKK